jgi:endogenous inhibitor of DNA gyrase (YacG/DUF329 family)
MTRGRCPVCGKSYAITRIDELPSFPFCSARCRLIDLGRWADGSYAIPGPEAPAPPPQGGRTGDDEDDG